jgi:hypothetical protein
MVAVSECWCLSVVNGVLFLMVYLCFSLTRWVPPLSQSKALARLRLKVRVRVRRYHHPLCTGSILLSRAVAFE